MQVSFTVAEISDIVQPKETRGTTSETIRGIASLGSAEAGELTFLGNPKYRSEVAGTRASVVLLPLGFDGQPQSNQIFLLVENPSAALARICSRIEQSLWPRPAPGIHPSAQVAAGAKIARSATVGPLCVVEADAVIGEHTHLQAQVFVGRAAEIGEGCWLMPGVTLAAECILKDRVRLQPGVIVGSDGFGYEFVGGRHEKIPQVGNVVIENDVEIGANTTLDRARFSRTVVGEGSKIDNLVQIAHNVTIGKHVIICALVGIAGSVTIRDYAVLGGQAGIGGHVTIGPGAKIGGQTAVTFNVESKAYINGSPGMPYMIGQRLQVLYRRLPELFKRVDEIEAMVRKS
ncbi:MAG: UDP-3-O-(3-hydroxymyristoyl) glucosamine N-acyltransferase [Verrucomicrobia bacterium]|nr:UDP-3-O-(3-hydroxymyristoyl) glucosamine N-acyltransferase [Verrucomicrobiota bacterium]